MSLAQRLTQIETSLAVETSRPDQLLQRVARPGDPVGFFREVLGWEPWSKQGEIARAVVEHRHVFVKKCPASGGTALMARLALWFLFSHSPSIVLTTAPTDRQVQQLLW